MWCWYSQHAGRSERHCLETRFSRCDDPAGHFLLPSSYTAAGPDQQGSSSFRDRGASWEYCRRSSSVSRNTEFASVKTNSVVIQTRRDLHFHRIVEVRGERLDSDPASGAYHTSRCKTEAFGIQSYSSMSPVVQVTQR